MIDSFSDSLNTVLHRITQEYAAPEFVKSASRDELVPDYPEDVLLRVCADPINLRYPCHTKAATWTSAAYFVDDYENLPSRYRTVTGEKIMKFAEYHGISQDVDHLIREKENRIKSASQVQFYPEDCYMLPDKKAGLMLDEAGVEAASGWLLANRNSLPYSVCADAAVRVCKQASALGVSISPEIERLTGLGFNDNASIASQLRKRAGLAWKTDSTLSGALMSIAGEFETDPPDVGSEVMMKTAAFVDEFDHRTGLIAARQRGDIPMPEYIFYRHTVSDLQKTASSHVKLQNGKIYSMSDLESADRAEFEGVFGTELADACFTGRSLNKEAAAQILPTLPRPMADQLSGMLKVSGVRHVRQEKAASAVTIPEEFFI